jgi:prolipoprotein diacylglyceryl transferase
MGASMFGWKVIPRIGIGPLQVSPHGIFIAIGTYVGSALLARRARTRDYDADIAWNAAAIGVVGAIVGARAAYVVGHLGDYSSALEWLQIWRGGLSLIGSLLGAFLAAWLYLRRKGVDFFTLADPGAAGLAIGIAIGRIGDLMIGDHLGTVTSKPWGWTYKGGELISASCTGPAGERLYDTVDGCLVPGMTVHQTALYDMLWSLAIFGVILLLERRARVAANRGFLFLTWAGLYSLGRIVTDFLRVDIRRFGTPFTGSQLTALAAVAVCAWFLARHRGIPRRGAAAGDEGAQPAQPPEAGPERAPQGDDA